MPDAKSANPGKQALLQIFQAAVHAVNGRHTVLRQLSRKPLEGEVTLIAVGKAAQAMADGARESLGGKIRRGLVVSKSGHLDFTRYAGSEWELLEGGHPIPNAGSLIAGERLLELLSVDDGTQLLFLISGGASSLLEAPVAGVDQAFLSRANDWLLASALPIDRINLVRKGLSRIKGGGLLRWIGDRPVRALAISDVPGDLPGTIGSGLLVPEPGLTEALEALPLPEWLQEPLARGMRERGEPIQSGPEIEIVANLDLAKQCAAEKARELGLTAHIVDRFIQGDAAENGRRMADTLCRGASGVTIWGGETTVRLPAHPGRGGRNQQLALAAAQTLVGKPGVWLLSAGTDGTDGPTDDAGALVDGGTLERALMEGWDADQALQAADAGSLLEATGDLITSGPTGTNVMDLIIGLKS